MSEQNKQNQQINSLTHCKFIEGKQNIGRNANRHLLASMAQYNWLLFIDSDTLPKEDSFIENYLKILEEDHDAVFGGLLQKNTKIAYKCTLFCFLAGAKYSGCQGYPTVCCFCMRYFRLSLNLSKLSVTSCAG